jgi:hypothetical protein
MSGWVRVAVWASVAVGAAAPARAEPPRNCYVLAVGINQYKARSIPDLRGAVNDARAVAALFEGQGPRVTVTTLLNEQATSDAIASALDDIDRRAGKGDRVVVYLSGHGSRNEASFEFVAHDTTREALDWADKEEQTRVELQQLLFARRLEGLARGREVLLIIDACHAGQILQTLAPALDQKADGGLVLLASSAASQPSLDGPDHSRFTKALLEALRGRADADGDGAVTLKEVRRYLSTRMKDLEVESPRRPGLPLAEQDFVCDASYSIPETLTLARPRAKASPLDPVKWLPAPEAKLQEMDGVAPGTWRASLPIRKENGEPLVGKDGNLLRQTFILQFRPNGIYTAVWEGPLGHQAGLGKWVRGRDAGELHLVFPGGRDTVHVLARTPKTLEIRVYPHGSTQTRTVGEVPFDRLQLEYDSRRPPTTYKLERVQEEE